MSVKTNDLSYDRLRSLVRYQDGELYWLVSRGRVKRGDKVGNIGFHGYLLTAIDGKKYRVHRLVFLLHNRYIPTYIDHINRDKLDNRIENLREAVGSINQINRGHSLKNKYRIKGIEKTGKRNYWRARIGIKGESYQLYLGTDFFEACCRRKSAENQIHGEYL